MQTQLPVQVRIIEAGVTAPTYLMLVAQPPTEPATGVSLHHLVGMHYRAHAEVVGPAPQLAVERGHHHTHVLPCRASVCDSADRFAQANDPLLRRLGAQVRPARSPRILSTERVTQ